MLSQPPRAALLLALIGGCRASSDSEPHYHSGKLAPYELGPPSLLLSEADESNLATGAPIMQAILGDDGVPRRFVMVRDIPTPAYVVMGRIMDLNRYDKMVQGVDKVTTYDRKVNEDGTQEVRAKYNVHALHMRLAYYMVHTYDPEQYCMTFALDYTKQSDLDDSVGYWFVQPRRRDSCRVFYSCETKLRGWVPAPVYSLLVKAALKQTTTWVNVEAIKEWQLEQERALNQGGVARMREEARRAMGDLLERSALGKHLKQQKPLKLPKWKNPFAPPQSAGGAAAAPSAMSPIAGGRLGRSLTVSAISRPSLRVGLPRLKNQGPRTVA